MGRRTATDTQRFVHYWLRALNDEGLSRGAFSASQLADGKAGSYVDNNDVSNGHIDGATVDELFEEADEAEQELAVEIRPFVFKAVGPDPVVPASQMITPIVARAVLNRSGDLRPDGKVDIPRELLEPAIDDKPTFGTAEDLRQATAERLIPGGWGEFMSLCGELVEKVCGPITEDESGYARQDRALVARADSPAFALNLAKFGRYLLKLDEPSLPLLTALTMSTPSRPSESPTPPASAHPNTTFPLAATQREALAASLALQPGEILAINGPPGTGKTTLLLSIVATRWVDAAVAGAAEPPLIVAASTNNQAVTNVIDAFGKDLDPGQGALGGRWISGIESYGSYFPARYREDEARRDGYQTTDFFTDLEAPDSVERAHEDFLRHAGEAFPGLHPLTVESVVGRLHTDLVDLAARLNRVIAYWDAQFAAQSVLWSLTEVDPADTDAARAVLAAEWADAEAAVLTQESETSIVEALLGWLPAVKHRRLARLRLALGPAWPDAVAMPPWPTAEAAAAHVRQIAETVRRLRQCRQDVTEDLGAPGNAKTTGWPPLATSVFWTDRAELHDRLDIGLRYRALQLATHYWEARWLEATVGKKIPGITKTGPAKVKPRWRRRMMLTPCAVSTFHMLPELMKTSINPGGTGFADSYLLDEIDLLIVDEAGQTSPAVGALPFALAKRAVVVGDRQQLKPIGGVSDGLDRLNSAEAGLATDEAEFAALADRGLAASSGSVLRAAQLAGGIHPMEDMDPGLYLFEHRRCRHEIIGFCNELCYHGQLLPMRSDASTAPPFAPLGRVHVNGVCVEHGSSVANELEAATIATWLREQREKIEQHYDQRSIANLVAVLTPFRPQAELIKKELAKAGLPAEITVGTVHAMQGAELPIVLFSGVYTKHRCGSFIDAQSDLLNVAVSRAQDTFIWFGDLDQLSTSPADSPRGQLWTWLQKHSDEPIEVPVGRPRSDLTGAGAEYGLLRDAEQHDEFLCKVLRSARERVHLVSPWVRPDVSEEGCVADALRDAVDNDVHVSVYADRWSNARTIRSRKGQPKVSWPEAVAIFHRNLEALCQIGVEGIEVENVHSKVLIVDDDVFCVGSFNWLSADRGDKANQELSMTYRGTGLSDEIAIFLDDLDRRKAKPWRS